MHQPRSRHRVVILEIHGQAFWRKRPRTGKRTAARAFSVRRTLLAGLRTLCTWVVARTRVLQSTSALLFTRLDLAASETGEEIHPQQLHDGHAPSRSACAGRPTNAKRPFEKLKGNRRKRVTNYNRKCKNSMSLGVALLHPRPSPQKNFSNRESSMPLGAGGKAGQPQNKLRGGEPNSRESLVSIQRAPDADTDPHWHKSPSPRLQRPRCLRGRYPLLGLDLRCTAGSQNIICKSRHAPRYGVDGSSPCSGVKRAGSLHGQVKKQIHDRITCFVCVHTSN